MSATTSSWTLPTSAPDPVDARRRSPWRRSLEQIQLSAAAAAMPDPGTAPPAPTPAPAETPVPTLGKQIALGLAIFAAVLAPALSLALVSEGLGLAAAVGVGSVLLALLARRLRIALVIATLLAVLGAFAAAHSVHLSREGHIYPLRLAALAPASGEAQAGTATPLPPAAVVAPVRIEYIGTRTPIAGWAFPGALFALWAFGFVAIRLNRAFARWLWRHTALWFKAKSSAGRNPAPPAA